MNMKTSSAAKVIPRETYPPVSPKSLNASPVMNAHMAKKITKRCLISVFKISWRIFTFMNGVIMKNPSIIKNWTIPTPILTDPAENIMKNGYIIKGIKRGRARSIASKKLGIICSILRSEPIRVEPHPDT
jgi:hypothetical protein